jgi:hypothetical protein
MTSCCFLCPRPPGVPVLLHQHALLDHQHNALLNHKHNALVDHQHHAVVDHHVLLRRHALLLHCDVALRSFLLHHLDPLLHP